MMKQDNIYTTLTDTNFQKEVLESQLPVLVEFGADWCGTCHILAPMIEELMVEYEGKFKVGKIDVDQNKSITRGYGIMELPTLLFLNQGQVVDHIIGAVPKSVLAEKLRAVLEESGSLAYSNLAVSRTKIHEENLSD
ncbi:MAG: thioredoxin [bacterium]